MFSNLFETSIHVILILCLVVTGIHLKLLAIICNRILISDFGKSLSVCFLITLNFAKHVKFIMVAIL